VVFVFVLPHIVCHRMEMEAAAVSRAPAVGHRVFLAASLAAINNLAFGYDVGVISGSLRDMASSLHLSTLEQEAATSGLNFVAGLGALLFSGNLLDRLGRRATLLISSVLLLLGAAVVCVAQGFPLLLLGRALQGLGSGCSWSACSVYITEIAPAHARGALVAIADISINVGILIGFAVDRLVNVNFDEADVRWRVAMALSAVMPALYVLLYAGFPESPRWLVMQGREAEARRVLRWFTRGGEAGAAEAVGAIAASARGERRVSWRGLLDPRVVPLKLLLLTCALGLGQQLTGTEAILYYTPAIINQCRADGSGADTGGANATAAGSGPAAYPAEPGGCTPAEMVFFISLGVGACKLVGEMVAAALVETLGRRSTLVGRSP